MEGRSSVPSLAEAVKSVFISSVLLLEQKTKVSFDVTTNENGITSAKGAIVDDGIRIIISSDGKEIQCLYDLAEDSPGQARKEFLLQSDQDRPCPIYPKQLENIDWDDIKPISKEYADKVAAFLGKLRAASN